MPLLADIPFTLVHDIRGRMRLRPRRGMSPRLSPEAVLCFFALSGDGLLVTISQRTGSILLECATDGVYTSVRTRLNLPAINPVATAADALVKRAPVSVEKAVPNPVPYKILSFFFPRLLNAAVSIFRAMPYVLRGLVQLGKGKLGLDVLDAAALGVCLLRRDFRTLSSITFFFSLANFLEHWTRKKSHADLAQSLALNISHVWIREGSLEREVPLAEVRVGDTVVVRAGFVVPVDGTIAQGEALINQASLTGEPLPVHRAAGMTVYAGTVVEEGEIGITASKVGSQARIHSILRYIEESETVKASIQSKYEKIADAIVPYNFLLAFLVYALTRNMLRASSVLLVDYSCAIRLTTPLTILSAMREAAQHGALIKGGKFIEALAEADTLVFDKTGTLTEACPEVVTVVPFGEYDEDTVLRLAACLEEHFPHPVGQAVVHAAERRNLKHREEHAKVEFVVAHGITSRLRGEKVLIGSEHFIVEDQRIPVTPEQRDAITAQARQGRSVLYLAVGDVLAGIIAIEDRLRPGMPELINTLRADGFSRIIMLTGDGPLTARAIADQAGIAEFKAALLPEEKADYIIQLQSQGCRVLMVGDGVNDAPALSAADVGAALKHGADMTKEVADMVLTNGDPADILMARRLARLAIARIQGNFHKSVAWNSLFLVGGLLGVLRPSLSALLHNASTAVLAVQSMLPLLPESLEKLSPEPTEVNK